MSADTYNGWKNYETWAVGMFLDGNYDGPFVYHETVERTRNAIQAAFETPTQYLTDDENERMFVADALKDYVEELCNPHMIDDDHPVQLTGLAADIFGAAMSQVDWHELADAWIQSARETV